MANILIDISLIAEEAKKAAASSVNLDNIDNYHYQELTIFRKGFLYYTQFERRFCFYHNTKRAVIQLYGTKAQLLQALYDEYHNEEGFTNEKIEAGAEQIWEEALDKSHFSATVVPGTYYDRASFCAHRGNLSKEFQDAIEQWGKSASPNKN